MNGRVEMYLWYRGEWIIFGSACTSSAYGKLCDERREYSWVCCGEGVFMMKTRGKPTPVLLEEAVGDPDTHTTKVEWSADDELFVARVVERPECTGHGKNEVEAIKMADENLHELRKLDREEAAGEVSAKWDDVLKQCMDFIVRPGEPSDRAIYWCVGVIADLKTALRELRRLDERLAEYRTTLGEKEDFINAQEDELHEKDAELSDWKGNYERMKAVALSDRAELRRVKDESEAFSKIAMRLRELNGELEAELRRREAK